MAWTVEIFLGDQPPQYFEDRQSAIDEAARLIEAGKLALCHAPDQASEEDLKLFRDTFGDNIVITQSSSLMQSRKQSRLSLKNHPEPVMPQIALWNRVAGWLVR